ncbi:hypothetical protein M8C13_22460 [Crossiella sp. SN42]|uniref:hypothetical protein n=1 Tax=Crossiella sp. SN42 TaxID=2944808 RepID=UPI00207C3F49|nr:hypothetical protein [Crossiella sp. SN42]MCO1578520.1 hypothetical protein [Crossiella sp. SN42]
MWSWLLGAFTCVLVVIVCCAAYVALYRTDERHRRDGYRVLALCFGLLTGSTGVLAVLLTLHESGLF